MMNQIILVGRLTKDPEFEELENGKKVSHITLAIQRPFKNMETGLYDTDFIPVTLWQGLAINIKEYCKKGSVIGIKGRVSIKSIEISDEKKFTFPEIIAENITFIN